MNDANESNPASDVDDSCYSSNDDFEDDEDTLIEEEKLENIDNNLNEIEQLKTEQSLSLEELRRRYCCIPDECRLDSLRVDINTNTPPPTERIERMGPMTDQERRYFLEEEDEKEDEDYVPPEAWKRQIRVGIAYQANIRTDDCSASSPCESPDQLIWRPPIKLDMKQVENYLQSYYEQRGPTQRRTRADSPDQFSDPDKNASSPNTTLRDDENALYRLLTCRYDNKSALTSNSDEIGANFPFKTIDSDSTVKWTDSDCDNFQQGLKMYGKNFAAIHKEQLPNRPIGELVQFYYTWKKTESHDLFVQKVRFEKRQYALNPDTTDYMDHVLEQMETTSGSGCKELNITSPPLLYPARLQTMNTSIPAHSSSSLLASDSKHHHYQGQWSTLHHLDDIP